MKVAVSATGKNLEAYVDPRFGRCPYFAVVDSETMECEFIENRALMASGGAGIKAAQQVVDAGVEVVISGNIGPNAFATLSAGGVGIYSGADGTIRDAVEKLKNDNLTKSSSANAGAHFGMRS